MKAWLLMLALNPGEWYIVGDFDTEWQCEEVVEALAGNPSPGNLKESMIGCQEHKFAEDRDAKDARRLKRQLLLVSGVVLAEQPDSSDEATMPTRPGDESLETRRRTKTPSEVKGEALHPLKSIGIE